MSGMIDRTGSSEEITIIVTHKDGSSQTTTIKQ